MGAQIILCDPHRATVIGQDKMIRLKGTVMSSPDIRAGVALLIAALSAEGKSVIHNIEQIDRGYQNIDKRLNALGADIQRVTNVRLLSTNGDLMRLMQFKSLDLRLLLVGLKSSIPANLSIVIRLAGNLLTDDIKLK